MSKSTLSALLLLVGTALVLCSTPADVSLVGLPLGLVADLAGFALIGVAVFAFGAEQPPLKVW